MLFYSDTSYKFPGFLWSEIFVIAANNIAGATSTTNETFNTSF